MILVGLAIVFLLFRISGLSLPYHQDEWKTVHAVEEGSSAIAHPPLTQLSYLAAEKLFGGARLRIVPFLFSFASFFLLYEVVRRRVNEKAALFSVFLYTISFYSVLASHMVDTDGALLPFFFLLSVLCYDRWNTPVEGSNRHWYWFGCFCLALLAGCMVKLSFVIVCSVFFVDFIVTYAGHLKKRELLILISGVPVFALTVGLLFLIIKFFYPAFQLTGMVNHALYYIHLSGRSYTQVLVQGIKALEYLSPLLIAPLLLSTKKHFRATRLFFLYMVIGFFFYFVLFDFSHGALDKYLMFLIVPLSVISGISIAPYLSFSYKKIQGPLFLGALLSLAVIALNFFHHVVLPLYPKHEWFARALHGEWNMLVPFTGGSGPLGFYVSFLFISTVFLLSLFLALSARFQKHSASALVTMLLFLGITYNGVFAEEYQWGLMHGSAPQVLRETLTYIDAHPNIQSLITYNDIGAYELSHMGKYANRFYAAPEYESVHQKRFSEFNGHFLVVEIPRIYEDSYYESFLNSCQVVFETTSQKIRGTVYDCRKT